jgi:hypothetical protein
MIYSKGLVYKYYLRDEDRSNEMFHHVIDMNPEHIAAVFAMAELELAGKNIVNNKTIVETTSDKLEIQNYPNPFNPSTTIKFSTPHSAFITLKVYDVLGKEIAVLVNEKKMAGKYEVIFNGSNLPSGLYLYSIYYKDKIHFNKMLLLK